MPQEQSLIPLIQQAYGKGVKGVDTSQILDIQERDIAEKKKEYKSATEIGLDLDLGRYQVIRGDLDSILKDASSGDLSVGSDEWVRRVGGFKAMAAQLKQAQDLGKQVFDYGIENPDLFSYYKKDETGDIIDAGFQGYVEDMRKLNEQKFDNYYERINQEALINQGVAPAKRSLADAYQALDLEAKAINKELIDSSKEKSAEVKRVPIGNNVYVDVVTNLNPAEVQEKINFLAQEFAEDFGREYSMLPADKRASIEGDTPEEKRDKYIKEKVAARIQKSFANQLKGYYAPYSSSSKKDKTYDISRTSGGGWANSYFLFDPISTTEVKVNSTGSSEPNKTWTGDDGEALTGKAAIELIRKNGDGTYSIKIVKEQEDMFSGLGEEPKSVFVPYERNNRLMEEFYGVTKSDLDSMFGGDVDGGGFIKGSTNLEVPKPR